MSMIGFIGLGIMGKPMAGHLMAGGHTLFLHSRSGVPAALVEAGGRACTSAAEVARTCRRDHHDAARHRRREPTCCSARTAWRRDCRQANW